METVEGRTIALQLYDTVGQERFAPLAAPYYRVAEAVLVFYDVTSRSSFEAIDYWKDEVMAKADPGVYKLLIGAKADMADSREVSEDDGRRAAEARGMSTSR